jgi:sigma-54-dependent transcriptional regulator
LPTVPLAIGDRQNSSNICIHCVYTGQLIKVDDVYRYSGFDFSDLYEYDRICHYRTQSLLTVPLRNHEGITIGVLQLLNPRDADTNKLTSFSDDMDTLVIAFASQAAVALDNVQLIEQNRHLIEVLDHTNQILEMENKRLLGQIEERSRFTNIVGDAESMRRVFALLKKVLDTDATVFLRGETGTGKELIAQAAHFNSNRRKREFVAQNCAALPEGLLESELFGYAKGAFSGANADKTGLIEFADGGTLFLDEIGDMPIGVQAKLLRVLQEKEVRPLGSTQSRKVNVRIITATHCDLQEKIRTGEFREDLYYRLCVFPIELPPLRERREDLPALLQHFISDFSERYGKEIIGISPAAMDHLLRYDYPGNIRELRNLVERAVLMCESGASILLEHLPVEIVEALAPAQDKSFQHEVDDSLRDAVGHFEAELIERKLEALNWNQTRAARELNISRRTLIDKMQRHHIQRPGEVVNA